ncbi:hypothetical protein LshimejAT787_1300830 [Lyophyllum shimeji]|uniref:Uncharacterized protein n=1 Tax=Lyophyllum shimeji TaxID=47721 RepID=A0A9P3USF5_LYOSH|nr:hypothetical protein LshimejAT787_1300830 [Lyophyllum shimeji]
MSRHDRLLWRLPSGRRVYLDVVTSRQHSSTELRKFLSVLRPFNHTATALGTHRSLLEIQPCECYVQGERGLGRYITSSFEAPPVSAEA